MKHIGESILSKKTGLYGNENPTGFPERFKMYEIGSFVEFLESNGFKWRPMVKTMDPSNLGISFGNHKCYSEGKPVGKIDKGTLSRIGSKHSTPEITEWFAFGDENRVYKITVLKLDESTGYIEYDFEVQQNRKITMVFQNYLQFRDSAIRFFGLK